MTRINTNVSSLVAQNTLGRSNATLNQALTRLSTGLRINTGKDDPAGLIASENLRSDITSIRRAISNTDRANQVIATADSALGQVSSLLNDIRGLVTESANAGALSEAQLDANQLQVDSSLEALNRISQTTTFQGRRLLDGSLDFITNAGSVNSIESLNIDQASLGATGIVALSVDISAAATQASLSTSVPATTAVNATGVTGFASEVTTAEVQATGQNLATFSAGPGQLTVTADAGTGSTPNGVTVTIIEAAAVGATPSAAFNGANIEVTVDNTVATSFADIATAIGGLTGYSAALDVAGDFVGATDSGGVLLTLGSGVDEIQGTDVLTVTADTPGAGLNGATVTFVETGGHGATPTAALSGNNIVVTVDDTVNTSLAAIATAIGGLTGYSAAASGTGDGNYNAALQTGGLQATVGDGSNGGTVGVDSTSSLAADLVFELSSSQGAEVFNFESGTSASQVINAVNLVSDALGISASNNSGVITFSSTEYGTSAFVDIDIISEGPGGSFETNLSGISRSTGTDIAATVNGITASGDGNELSINTATLDLSLTVTAGSSTDFNFDISGGGALFQLGPDVVTNQQARLGIQSVNTARLGGVAGLLYELGSGNAATLDVDPNRAAQIVEEAIDQVTSLRGRLGAFQRTTLETNKNALNDTLVNLSDAESQIRDADFASESAELTRAQILVQSGTTVLSIANQNPQNVLALLR
jgi:flagellin